MLWLHGFLPTTEQRQRAPVQALLRVPLGWTASVQWSTALRPAGVPDKDGCLGHVLNVCALVALLAKEDGWVLFLGEERADLSSCCAAHYLQSPFAVQDKSSTAVQRACRSLGTNYANAPLAQVHACPCTAPCLQQASICKKTRDDFQESELEGRVKSKERDIASFACSLAAVFFDPILHACQPILDSSSIWFQTGEPILTLLLETR